MTNDIVESCKKVLPVSELWRLQEVGFYHDIGKEFCKVFDKDNNGRLSVDEIREVFGGDIKTWKKVIEDIDLNKDGEVDFKEFKAMMMNIDKKIVFGDESKIPKIAKSNC